MVFDDNKEATRQRGFLDIDNHGYFNDQGTQLR